jgi:hypothetical protein
MRNLLRLVLASLFAIASLSLTAPRAEAAAAKKPEAGTQTTSAVSAAADVPMQDAQKAPDADALRKAAQNPIADLRPTNAASWTLRFQLQFLFPT